MIVAEIVRPELFQIPSISVSFLFLYIVSLSVLFVFGLHGYLMVYHFLRNRSASDETIVLGREPVVTVQLPLYNECYVAERLIDSVCSLRYPREKLEIQVLDDSTDETTEIVRKAVERHSGNGFDIKHIRRKERVGFKAGALQRGLETARGEFIAIFDADFVPRPSFLETTLPHFSNPAIAMVQTRWEHLNRTASLLTRAQAMALDGHFVVEQLVRNRSGFFINFNGTAGIWRRQAIEQAGGWQADTLTEDLDISFRAQLIGWKFKYLPEVTSPGELPSEMNAVKSQQFRWTKGSIETARKILPSLWKSKLPLRVKLQSTFQLTNNFVFPFILMVGLLNVPLLFIKHTGAYDGTFSLMSLFVLAFVGSFLLYLVSQKAIYKDWKKKLLLFPLFLAGSMGLAVNNTRAVFQALRRKKSEFIRTPKYQPDPHQGTRNPLWKYSSTRIDWVMVVEMVLGLYCFFGVISSLYLSEIAALPFQLLYCSGFTFISILSVKHALASRRVRR